MDLEIMMSAIKTELFRFYGFLLAENAELYAPQASVQLHGEMVEW